MAPVSESNGPKLAYDPSLVQYLEDLGQYGKPTEVLSSQDRVRHALSEVSPMGLVGLVARELEPEALEQALNGVSEFARGRVMLALGHREMSGIHFRLALAESEDAGVRGRALMNLGSLAICEGDHDSAEQLFRQAIDEEGMLDAYWQWSFNLLSEKQRGMALKAWMIAEEGFKRGANACLPVLCIALEKVWKSGDLSRDECWMKLGAYSQIAQERGLDMSEMQSMQSVMWASVSGGGANFAGYAAERMPT